MRTNQYAGVCYVCGLTVAAGTGRFERHQGAWRVKHAGDQSVSKNVVTCAEAKKKAQREKP